MGGNNQIIVTYFFPITRDFVLKWWLQIRNKQNNISTFYTQMSLRIGVSREACHQRTNQSNVTLRSILKYKTSLQNNLPQAYTFINKKKKKTINIQMILLSPLPPHTFVFLLANYGIM